MKRRWTEITPTWVPGPMSFWVHVEVVDRQSGRPSHSPPLPVARAGWGHMRFFAEYDGFVFEFASLDEVRACIAVLGQKNMPTSFRLAAGRPGHEGPNTHWLSRLPARTKRWRYRQGAVQYLKDSLRQWSADGLR
ncbi:MAG: hypothetical protein AAGA56_11155 [Myxococcota bacterium]